MICEEDCERQFTSLSIRFVTFLDLIPQIKARIRFVEDDKNHKRNALVTEIYFYGREIVLISSLFYFWFI